MKLSTKGRYGVVAMYDLAANSGNSPISLKSVAARQNISEHYLEQLMGQLRRAGLVKSARGAQGGYLLVKHPSEITIGDIVRVMEGPIAPVDCLLTDDPSSGGYCQRTKSCVTRGIWQKVGESIARVLDSITLADLCEEKISPETKPYLTKANV
ncbi:MAG: Rrf2 family transcriptional regulator [Acidaminococcales bacterium]|nr:Rrf2 family transcriptional regulator [Acidaminococcales bacterium]